MTVIVLALGIMVAVTTGNILPLLLMLVASGLFWLVELEFRPGSAVAAIQYFAVRVLSPLIVVGFGALFIYLGRSELSAPVAFSRFSHRALIQGLRNLVGSEGVASLFFIVGAIAVAQGIQMFSRLISAISGKESAPQHFVPGGARRQAGRRP